MLNPTAQVTTVSTVASGAQVMGIDEAGMGTVLSILSNMYSDGSLAVAREYICNALDSHVEAGNTDPVLVTSPSHFDPTLTVQDFGVGLSHDEVLNVYAKYGSSTKRNSNGQIGAFGIGAKSAFTVGTQFVVTAVKDGELTVALFALNSDGAPTVNIVQRTSTDEPNGVKIEVGVRDVQGVQNALDKLCTTLPVGSVMVDGVQPPSVWTSTKALADDVHVAWREDRYDDSDPAWVVVMGGVPYSMPESVINSLDHRQRTIVRGLKGTDAKVILSVPIGAADITPSREDLRVTDKTTATLNTMIEKFNQLLPGWISEQIDEAKTLVAAMILRRQLQSRIGGFAREHLDNATWRGQKMGIAKVELGPEHEQIRLRRGRSYTTIAKREKGLQLVPNSDLERMLFVVNTPARRVRSVQLAAKPYLQDQDKSTGHNVVVALTTTHFAQEWFDTRDAAIATVEFDDFVAKWKPVVPPSARTSGGAQYRVGSGDQYADTLCAEELNDLGEKILYLTTGDQDRLDYSNPFLARVTSNHTVVFLKSTQKEEVLRKRVPLAESAWPHITKAAKDTLKSLSQTDLDTMAAQEWWSVVNSRYMDWLTANRNSITNPVVVNVLNTYTKVKALRSNDTGRMRLLNQAAMFLSTSLDTSKKSSFSTTEYHKMVAGLPLLKIYLDNSWQQTPLGSQHMVQHINSIAL